MANDRSQKIRKHVQRVIGNIGSTFEGVQSLIYETMNRIQTQIAEDCLCLEGSEDISVGGEQELYDFPDDFINERKLVVDGGSIPLTLITLDKVEELKRAVGENPDWVSDTPIYYYRWGNQFGFLGANGAVSSGDTTIKIYFWRVPDETEQMSDNHNPALSQMWDTAIRLGTLADLTGSNEWQKKFEFELARRASKERNKHAEAGVVLPTGDYE
jgi:hypothetical protein